MAGAVALALASPAGAIVVSDNPNAAWHLAPAPSEYQMVGLLTTAGTTSAVLINPWFILTANHATNSYQTRSFVLKLEGGNQTYGMIQKYQHSVADLAVVRLNRSTGLDGYGLYRDTDEQTQNLILAGYGLSGTPATVGAGGDPAYPKGTLRIGQNKVDAAGDLRGDGARYIRYDFDDPSTTDYWGSLGADKEVLIGYGDSGGPSFLRSGGSLLVAGINLSVYDVDQDGKWPEYRDYAYAARVSTYASWIDSIIPSQPATVTGDFNMDDMLSALDVNSLVSHRGGTDMWYDLTADGAITNADIDQLIYAKIGTEFGDANLDLEVGLADYNLLAANFGRTSGVLWQDGDFNSDGKVSFADYQILEAAFGFGGAQGSLPGVPVPEPASLLLLAGGAAMVRRRRRPCFPAGR